MPRVIQGAGPAGELPQSPPSAATAPSEREPWSCVYRSGSVPRERAAEHPRGVRRIRKAAKPPTAAQGGGPYGPVPRKLGTPEGRKGTEPLPYRVFYRCMRDSGRSPLRHGFAVPPLPKGEARGACRKDARLPLGKAIGKRRTHLAPPSGEAVWPQARLRGPLHSKPLAAEWPPLVRFPLTANPKDAILQKFSKEPFLKEQKEKPPCSPSPS